MKYQPYTTQDLLDFAARWGRMAVDLIRDRKPALARLYARQAATVARKAGVAW